MIIVEPFAIMGDWDPSPTPQDLLRIVMPPLGAVAGGGWHASTQAALRALPAHVMVGSTFAEIGAGSAILSIAAFRLGAAKCYALEAHPEACVAARRVVAANAAPVEVIETIHPVLLQPVDVAVVSISTEFWREQGHHIKAKTVLVVHNDYTVEVVQ